MSESNGPSKGRIPSVKLLFPPTPQIPSAADLSTRESPSSPEANAHEGCLRLFAVPSLAWLSNPAPCYFCLCCNDGVAPADPAAVGARPTGTTMICTLSII